MVEKDRLDELMGGGSSDDEKEEKTNDTPSQPTQTSSPEPKEQKKTKKDKLNAFKGGQSKKESDPSGGDTEDVKNLLFALANMDAYTRIVKDYEFSGFNRSQTKVKDDFAKDVSGEITNFLGVFDIRDITDKYGYQWKNIMQIAIENQDMRGDTLRTNSGNVDSDDVKNLLECVANVILFIEGNKRSKEDMDNRGMKDNVILRISNGMHDQYKDIISKARVQTIAEKNGFDWKDDILQGVLTDQNFESKLK